MDEANKTVSIVSVAALALVTIVAVFSKGCEVERMRTIGECSKHNDPIHCSKALRAY